MVLVVRGFPRGTGEMRRVVCIERHRRKRCVKLLLPKISIMIPAKNEQDAIASIVEGCKKVQQGIDTRSLS
jgi:hypothetical protein